MGNCFKKPANCVHASSSKFSGAEKPTSQKAVSASSEKATYISNVDTSLSNNPKSFSFNDLKIAARNFRPETLLGEGGFGCVYKGWIDPDTLAPTRLATGIAVAIKKFKPESFQGHKEWLAEVNYLGQLHHENLVKLIGYCSESDNRLLVYEFMAKGSLENHLFRRGVQPIDWATRMKVIIGVARGLAFLHSLDANVIFRDLKGSNILLDSDYNAKLSDFGLARDGPTGDNTHVSTRIVGTQGYAAPEYVATGHLTPKSDVYSFGVVLLELLTGMPVMEEEQSAYLEETLVEWAKPFLSDDRRVLRIMDTRLAAKYSRKEAYAAASLALNCLQIDPRLRPSMINVVNILEQFHKRKDAP